MKPDTLLETVIATIPTPDASWDARAWARLDSLTKPPRSLGLLEEVAQADASGMALLRDAADSMHLSARGYHRVLRVARTLADLDGADKVGRVHLAEALSYRALTDEVRRAA